MRILGFPWILGLTWTILGSSGINISDRNDNSDRTDTTLFNAGMYIVSFLLELSKANFNVLQQAASFTIMP